MAKPSRKKQPKSFDVHRTLPSSRHSSTIPSAKEHKAVETFADEPGERKKRLTWKRVLALILILPIIFLLVIGIWDARNFSHASQKMFGSSNLFDLLSPSGLKTSAQGQVNVLLVGYSVDDPGHPGASLTDSIMVLSLNAQKHTGYMLSIPRDLYVNIPGFGYGKINEAYQDGNSENFSASGYPAGGMGLLEQVISNNFQISTSYYALIDYTAVREIVNALGGITVNIQSPDPRGLFDPNISPADGGPLNLTNGIHVLDGQTALNLTRARGDPCNCGQVEYGFPQSDFNRTQHQRQVLIAIKQKINWKLILDPRKNSKIFNAAADNVKTDVGLSEVRPLYTLFNEVNGLNMQSISLNQVNGVNLLRSYATSSGESALIPAAGIDDYSQIDAAISQLNQ